MKSSPLNLLLIPSIALVLASCVSHSTPLENSMALYSPEMLRVKKGSPIQTIDGVYIPQVDEVWHSHSVYLDRVREGLK